ncbi:hypothetical protein E2320_015358, partial [Naja naja]
NPRRFYSFLEKGSITSSGSRYQRPETRLFLAERKTTFPLKCAFDPTEPGREELRKMMGNSESMESTQFTLPKHILDIWAIVLIILGTIVIMTLLVLCPATTVIIYRVWTHPMHHNGAE